MNRQITLLFATIIIAGLLLTTGCRKFSDKNILAASNNSVAIKVFDDIFNQVDQIASVDTNLTTISDSSWVVNNSVCTTVTLEPMGTTFPKTLTIDFGDGCVGPDGVSRSGKIMAVFSRKYSEEGSEITVTLEDYKTGQYAVSGTKVITNGGENGSGNTVFNVDVKAATVAWGDASISWESTLTRTWVEGAETNFFTPDTSGGSLGWSAFSDDVYEITGTASGNDRNGHPYSMEISAPLVVQVGCAYIGSGVLTISPANYDDGTVDYGNGDCNIQATVEIGGQVYNFTM